jgi:hypothetical protein
VDGAQAAAAQCAETFKDFPTVQKPNKPPPDVSIAPTTKNSNAFASHLIQKGN